MTKRMSHIRRNMKKENTEYRPEQLLLAKIFRELLGKDYQVYTRDILWQKKIQYLGEE